MATILIIQLFGVPELLQQLPKLSRHLLQLIQLLLRDFPALHELFNFCFRVALKRLLKLPELLYHVLKLSHLAWHLPAAEGLKQGVSDRFLPPLPFSPV